MVVKTTITDIVTLGKRLTMVIIIITITILRQLQPQTPQQLPQPLIHAAVVNVVIVSKQLPQTVQYLPLLHLHAAVVNVMSASKQQLQHQLLLSRLQSLVTILFHAIIARDNSIA
jgi:hypothetical protein